MKPGLKPWRKVVRVSDVISKIFVALGLLLFLLNVSKDFLIISGILYALSTFMKAFLPIQEEPQWENVYPELALSNQKEKLKD